MAYVTHTSSALSGAAVVPSDSATIVCTKYLFIGVAGDVYVDFVKGGTNVKMTAATAGEHPWQVTRVYATGTTATGIVALY